MQHRLILPLLCCFAGFAQTAHAAPPIIDKSQAISRATDIISSGLRASLDFSGGDDLAPRLASLYDYMVLRLIHANVKNDTGALHEVSGLLTEIRGAWEEIADDPAVLSATKAAA